MHCVRLNENLLLEMITREKNINIGRKMMEISLKLEARFKINNKISAIPYGLR